MKVSIIAIGRKKKDPTTEIFNDYKKRLPWDITLKEIEEKKNLPDDIKKDKEAGLLLSAVDKNSVIISLDGTGKQFSSEEFAAKISDFQNDGYSNISFLIGGASGHGKEVNKRAKLVMSLGKMTWPHAMVRAMLMEQIYRAHTIIQRHPYHK